MPQNDKLQKELDRLRAEYRPLKDKLFAAKSEKKRSEDPSNRLDVPEKHCPVEAKGIFVVDRCSAYKAMAQVKSPGGVVSAICIT